MPLMGVRPFMGRLCSIHGEPGRTRTYNLGVKRPLHHHRAAGPKLEGTASARRTLLHCAPVPGLS